MRTYPPGDPDTASVAAKACRRVVTSKDGAWGPQPARSRTPTDLRRSAKVAILALGLLVPGSTTWALDFVVTRLTDSPGPCAVNDCSLRAAVIASNALGGADRILLGAGTYLLSIGSGDNSAAQGDLDIRGELEIVGLGPVRTVIDGGLIDRVFEVRPEGEGGDLTLRHLAVIHGEVNSPGSGGGAGIRVQLGSLTLDDVVVSDNYLLIGGSVSGAVEGGGGISSFVGQIRITDSAIVRNHVSGLTTFGEAGDGGGIRLGGVNDVRIVRSRIEHNRSWDGDAGGIVVGDPGPLNSDPDHLELIDSVVAHNISSRFGGGLYFIKTSNSRIEKSTIVDNQSQLSGGGIYVDTAATVDIVNSTLTRNQTVLGGGAGFVVGEVHLENVTIHDNLAGFFTAMAMTEQSTFKSTIFSGTCNPGETGFSLGGNLESPGDLCGLVQASDQKNVSAIALALSELGWHGGPTPTYIPELGSLARDRGTDLQGCPEPDLDQRGGARPLDGDGVGGAACDVGAVEAALTEQGAIFVDGFENRDRLGRWSSVFP